MITGWWMRVLTGGLAAVALVLVGALPAAAHDRRGEVRRVAVVSAFAPEMAVLRGELDNATVHSINGVEFVAGTLEGRDVLLFLSGISVVNAAMTVQLALDHFLIDRIVFSGIAGGVDPALHIGDVVIADRWGQYLEALFARKVEGGWAKPPFFDYPFANFGMMFPRSVTVQRANADAPETRFWFPVDEALLAHARTAAADVVLDRCLTDSTCLQRTPKGHCRRPRSVGGRLYRQCGIPRLYVQNLWCPCAGHGKRRRGARGLCEQRAVPRRPQPVRSGGRRRGQESDRGLFRFGGEQLSYGRQGTAARAARLGPSRRFRRKRRWGPRHQGVARLPAE